MAPRFIIKTSLTGLHPLALDGTRLLELHRRLHELLVSRAPSASSLFAEPVVTWPGRNGTADDGPGSVSWYTEEAGPAEPMTGLEPFRRDLLAERLRGSLRALQPLLDEPETGPLLRRALCLGHENGIMSVGGAPVLTEWGLVLGEAGSADEMIERGTAWIRPYLAPAPRVAAPIAPAVTPVPAQEVTAAAPGRWWLVPAAALVALLFLGIGLFAGIRAVTARVAERPTEVALLDEQATRDATTRQREQNVAPREGDRGPQGIARRQCLRRRPGAAAAARAGPCRGRPRRRRAAARRAGRRSRDRWPICSPRPPC